jgi:hypothetical protein
MTQTLVPWYVVYAPCEEFVYKDSSLALVLPASSSTLLLTALLQSSAYTIMTAIKLAVLAVLAAYAPALIRAQDTWVCSGTMTPDYGNCMA